MAINIMLRAQSFVPGCDLWIISRDDRSGLYRKIDWYLNFQLTKAHNHKTEESASQLKTIISENNMPNFSPELISPAALMVVAEDHFPVKSIIEIAAVVSPAIWVKQVHQIWTSIGKPTLRVFLPQKISADEFKLNWSDSENNEIYLVSS
ncbi:MAG: hypothetical protein A2Z20_06655 [Bdellovibrionales bacterium RBG_16_40_8]|nr:MAG: hypothetical protein A2Z20_06655 [Bdellovibrionales bacterium RBG_16_40_8]